MAIKAGISLHTGCHEFTGESMEAEVDHGVAFLQGVREVVSDVDRGCDFGFRIGVGSFDHGLAHPALAARDKNVQRIHRCNGAEAVEKQRRRE